MPVGTISVDNSAPPALRSQIANVPGSRSHTVSAAEARPERFVNTTRYAYQIVTFPHCESLVPAHAVHLPAPAARLIHVRNLDARLAELPH